jgi:hypothetical protein
MKRDIIIFALIILTNWITATTTHTIATRNEQAAIKNAIAHYEPSPLNCEDNEILEAVKGLADNGAHVRGYQIWLEMDNEDKQ